MKERPIIFTHNIDKILDGTKTQSRRVIKPQPTNKHGFAYLGGHEWRFLYQRFPDGHLYDHLEGEKIIKCPYGQVGDRLWVRETWATYQANDDWKPSEIPQGATIFRGSEIGEYGYIGKRRSSRFMPRWASRITLEITGIRVERLQEITEEGARAEGCTMMSGLTAGGNIGLASARYCFKELWDSLNAKRGYATEEYWGHKKLTSGYYQVRFEPDDDYRRIYVINSEWGLLWGEDEYDDPEALELDIRNPELMDIIDDNGRHYHPERLKRRVKTVNNIYAWESNAWVWVIEFRKIKVNIPERI